MSSIEDQLLRVTNAGSYLGVFSTDSVYAFIGKETQWPVESSPETPTSYTQRMYDMWTESYACKKINSTDVAPAARRYNWTTGTVYDQYDAYDNLLAISRKFYILTDENKVYKCLNNNGNAASTVKPTATSANTAVVTGDGYRWKYIYTLTSDDVSRFLTSNHMPIRNVTSNNIAAGSIESYRITNGGTGYSTAPSVTVIGDGTGATATAVVSGGVITKIVVSNSGSGYTVSKVLIAGGGGIGATVLASIAPKGGHGFNNLGELFTKYVIHSIRFLYDEGGTFSVANDYRKVHLVRNPLLSDGVTVATGSSYRLTTGYGFSAQSGSFLADEVISSGTGNATKTANVVEWNAGTSTLYVNGIFAPTAFAAGNTITGLTSGATGTISGINLMQLRQYTGDPLYYEFRTPVTRAADQIETFRVVFEF